MPRIVEREMCRGDAPTYDFTVRLGGSIQNVTGWKFWLTAKHHYDDDATDAAAVFQLTSDPGGGIDITDAPNGRGSFTIPKEATDSLPAREVVLVYDLQVVDSDGKPITLERGNLHVFPDVTRRTT